MGRGEKWTEREEDILRESYAETPIKKLQKMLPGRSYDAIKIHALSLGLARSTKAWTEEEIATLCKYYPLSKTTIDDLDAMLPGRSIASIYAKAHVLRLSRPGDSLRKPIPDESVEYVAGLTMLQGKPPTIAQTMTVLAGIEGRYCGKRHAAKVRKKGIELAKKCGWRKTVTVKDESPHADLLVKHKAVTFKPWERQLLLDYGHRLSLVELQFLMPRRSRGQIIQLLQYLGLNLKDEINDAEPPCKR